jgi:hypothetical protein
MTTSLAQRKTSRAFKQGQSARLVADRGWSAEIHPGLVVLAGSQSSLLAVASNDGNGAMPVLPQVSGHRATPLSRQIARENLSLTKRHEPASFPLREGSDVLPRHVQKHEGSHVREVVNCCRE